MARQRIIKPEFWTNERVVECSLTCRLLFIGMWNFSDDGGVHRASIKTLKMQVFPGDDIKSETIRSLVDELIANGLVTEYEVSGDKYWKVTGWDHQKIEYPTYTHPGEDGFVPKAPSRGKVFVDDKSTTSRKHVVSKLSKDKLSKAKINKINNSLPLPPSGDEREGDEKVISKAKEICEEYCREIIRQKRSSQDPIKNPIAYRQTRWREYLELPDVAMEEWLLVVAPIRKKRDEEAALKAQMASMLAEEAAEKEAFYAN